MKKTIAILAKTIVDRPDLRHLVTSELATFNVVFCNDTAPILDHAQGQTVALLVGREKVDKNFMSRWPHVKCISKYGVGLDNIDLPLLKKKQVALLRQDGINSQSVAEFTIGLMLSLSRLITNSDQRLRQGDWVKNGGFLLSGKTVAIIGCGAIGSKVAKILNSAFGCPIYLNDIVDKSEFAERFGGCQTSLLDCLKVADLVTLHVPYDASTHNLISRNELAAMKPTAFLVNTSRGLIVDEKELKQALKNKRLAGAAFDVFAEEPLKDFELFQFDNVICTPHIAGNAAETVKSMVLDACRQIRDFWGTK